jgi:hypothetical protein
MEERYFMNGFYEQDGEKFPQVGIFTFNVFVGSLEGIILDPRSTLTQKIFGRITKARGNVEMTFVKEQEKIKYILEKSDSKRSIRGKYRGYWTPLSEIYKGRGLATIVLEYIEEANTHAQKKKHETPKVA